METRGVLTPNSEAAATEYYTAMGPAAQQAVRELARAMDFDSTEFDDRITEDVIATARDAFFAGLLTVHIGSTEEFDAWQADHPSFDLDQTGSENVDNVAWHPAPLADTVIATTFQAEPDAAVAALRRQAWGRIYRDRLTDT